MSVSHKGAFLLGSVAGLPLLVASGRCHLYEGYSAAEVCTGVRVLAGLGVKTLILTNASGALNPQFRAGSLLCVTDQINWTGLSPLTGPNDDARGLRFPDLSRPYAPELVELACATAVRLGIYLERGVYIGVHGPELETPAETRLYRSLGADAIGMSSVLEVIAARHLGLRVLGLSCLGNVNRPDCMEEIVLEDILAACRRAENDLSRLLVALVPELQKRER